MKVYFSDVFNVLPKTIEDYGAFDISLVTDLPLFIDPFLLFNSKKPEYQQLHQKMIDYLKFLKEKTSNSQVTPGLVNAWFRFPEIKQTWLGFASANNSGNGLGKYFANALHDDLYKIFKDFGTEKVTHGSHLEKLCLVREGVGKDHISDFTTNLILSYLLEYTATFASKFLDKSLIKKVTVSKVIFNYKTESWEPAVYELPYFKNDFVLLTPKDILTKDSTWINRHDLVDDFEDIPEAIPNDALRAQINNYFLKILPKRKDEKEPTKKDKAAAAIATILKFPEIIDYYIKQKEDNGERAESLSQVKVAYSEQLFIKQSKILQELLETETNFYKVSDNTHSEALEKVKFLKDVIENKGGHKIFYVNGRPVSREEDLHVMYRLVWCDTESDVTREANDGRGPADFKVSRGRNDKTIVEFKLAKNTQLEKNLKSQTKIYEKASDATNPSIKVITYFTIEELNRVVDILKRLQIDNDPNVVLIDGRNDNKPSGSKA